MKNHDITSEVYNALTDIMFESGANQSDMEEAIEFFLTHFFEDEYEEEDE